MSCRSTNLASSWQGTPPHAGQCIGTPEGDVV